MGWLDWLRGETRDSIENPQVKVSAENFMEFFSNLGGGTSAAGVKVSTETALGVPAVWAAVNFLSSTLASLPIKVYRKTKDGRKEVTGSVAAMLSVAANDGLTSFDWRKHKFDQVFTTGRGLSYVERNLNGRVVNLWPLDPAQVTIRRVGGVKSYLVKDGSRTITYAANEILDVPFMLKADLVSHRSPIQSCRDAIGMAIAATNYGSKYFENGGVPPFAIEGPFEGPASAQRASDDLARSVKKASKLKRLALSIPLGHKLHKLGSEIKDAQLVELHRFMIEQTARIYSMPPTFLQDLTHGTFSNTEQQDLHFVKHTLRRWVRQFEQELNLKLFGRNSKLYAEMNLDGLLRGDFKTRMEGYAQGIQNAILTPDEARAAENRQSLEGGDQLWIQGGTLPVANQLKLPLDDGKGD